MSEIRNIDGSLIGIPGKTFRLERAPGNTGSYILSPLTAVSSAVHATSSTLARRKSKVLDAICDVTGYDPASLNSNMKFEEELGLDFIKRQKILKRLEINDVNLIDAQTVGEWLARIEPEPEKLIETSSEDPTEVLLRIAQEKTGYSRAELDLDADLEADLGIDTIKQVQIIAQLRALYNLPFKTGLRVKDFPTLRHWIRLITENQSYADTQKQSDAFILKRLQAHLVEASPLLKDKMHLKRVVLSEDEYGVARSLKQKLTDIGVETFILNVSEIVPQKLEALGAIDAFLHLAALSRKQSPAASLQVSLRVCKFFDNTLKTFVAVTGTGGGLGLNEAANSLESDGAISGFVKSLAKERPDLNARLIDLNPLDPRVAEILFNELQSTTAEVEVGYLNDSRVRADLKMTPLDLSGQQLFNFTSESNILIVGGAQGVCAEVAKSLAKNFKTCLILCGRSSPDSNAVMQTLAEINSAGAKATYYQCDVTSDEEVNRLRDTIKEKHVSLTGLIFGAGQLADKRIEQKSEEELLQVYRVKTNGFKNFSNLIKEHKPNFVVGFTSLAGRIGNVAQTDYAAANAALAALILQLRHDLPQTRTFAIAWGAWEKVGMLARSGLEPVLRASGIGSITLEEGLRCLENEVLFGGQSHEVVITSERTDLTMASNVQPDGSHALLESFSIYEKGSRLLANMSLSANKYRWLSDHVIADTPILPATFGIEIMTQAALALFSGFRFQSIRNFKIHKPVQILQDEYCQLAVNAVAQCGSSQDRRQVVVTLSRSSDSIAFEGIIEVIKDAPTSAADKIELPLFTSELSNDRIYSDYIALGPTFHLLSGYQNSGENRACTLLKRSPAFVEQGPYHSSPDLREAAFHTAGLMNLLKVNRVLLPRALSEFIIHDSNMAREEIRIEATQKAPTIFDINFYDTEGRLCAEMRDFQTVDLGEMPQKESTA